MKSSRIVVLLVAVFALALVWRVSSRRAAAAPVAAPEAAARASAPAAPPAPAAVASPVAAGATLPALFGARGPVTLGEVPAGRFREQLLKLAPAAQTRALATLERLRIPHNDVEALATDVDGHLFYECAREPAGTPPPPAALPVASAAPVAVTMPPIRHSRPGASRVLYLDFNGHNVIDTAWNAANVSSGRPAVDIYACRPYDRDGDVTTFSDTEQAEIVAIWQRVAEDYSAFDVDVTTEEPAAFTAQTLRALVTHTIDANGVANPSSATASGVAYLDVFGRDNLASYSPAFVYYDVLSSAASVAEVVSHELGHNLALSHDGTLTKSYYPGHGTGELSWGPIMGAPFSRTVTQWSKGEYFNANNPQDDLAIIGARLTLRADVAGNSLATATPAPNTGNDVSGGGLVRAAGESYFHRVITAAGRIGFTAAPVTSGNADLRLELLDANGVAVALDDPEATRIGGVFTANPVPAGVYYLKITAAGTGTPLIDPPTGYTSYGSIGQYTLTGTVVAAAPAIVSGTTASVGVGHPFHYQTIAAGDVSSYGAAGLPPGVTIDATTGILSGRPTATGVYSVTLSANNSIGTNTATLTLTVNNAAPAVTASSAPAVVLAPAESTTLSVTSFSVNGAVAYQWFRNGRAIAGATGATHNVSAAERGLAAYWVTLTNTVGTTRSAPFFVRVAPAVTQVVAWGTTTSSAQTTIPAGLGRVVDVAAGPNQSVALRADGSVVSWGNTSVVPAVNDAVAIATGDYFTVVLRRDGTVTVLGSSSAAVEAAASLRDVVAVAAGYHCVALRSDGTVVTWDGSGNGLVAVPGNLTNVVAIAAAGYTTLALKADGTVVGWGSGTVTPPVGLAGVKAIAASANRGLALKAGGTTVAWGGGTAAPNLLSENATLAICAGASYALEPDGKVIAWGTSNAAWVPPGDLSNVFRLACSSSHAVAVRDAAGDSLPAITTQPLPALRAIGAAQTFRVTATGPGVLSYQWRKDGSPIAGATTASLALDRLQNSDAGTYDVVVSNHAGSVTSSGALLTLEAPPAITARPARMIDAANGASVPLEFTASSAHGPLAYQWKKDNRPLPGATTPTLTIDAFTPAKAGAYVLEITDAHGLVTRAITFVRPVLGRTQVAVWGSTASGITEVPRDLGDAVGVGIGTSGAAAVRANGAVAAWGAVTTASRTKLAALTDVVATAVLGNRVLTLRSSGRVTLWDDVGNESVQPIFDDAIAIVAGNGFAAALLADGNVRTWGDSAPTVPAGAGDIVAMAAGSGHLLALRRDGMVAAWGSNDNGQCNVPAGLADVVAVAGGGSHSLALKADGTVVGWGSRYYGETTPPGDLGAANAITAGANFSLAQRADGSIVAWGSTNYDYRSPPADVSNLVALGAGNQNPFVLRQASADAGPVITLQPAAIATAAGVPQRLTVRATGAGALGYQWRRNGVAIAGATGPILEFLSPQAANAGSYDVVITNHVATVTSTPATLSIVAPPTLSGGSPLFLVVKPGEYLRLTVTASSSTGPLSYQWKRNNRPLAGATGTSLTLRQFTPADAGAYTVEVTDARGAVSRRTSFVVADVGPTQVQTWGSQSIEGVPADLDDAWALRGGNNVVLALRRSGALLGWGGYSAFDPTPTGVDQPLVDAVAYTGGAIALRADGTLFSWGSSLYSGAHRNVPANLRDVIALAGAGDSSAYALRSDGRVYFWSAYSGLAAVPLDLPPITAIAAGYSQVLMLGTDGKVYQHGYDSYGASTVPVGLTDVTAIAANETHSLAVKSDGTVVAWGSNSFGQTTVPADATDVVSVDASYYNSLVVRRDGTVRIWGTSSGAMVSQPANLGQVIDALLPGDGAAVLRRSAGDLAPTINQAPVAVGIKRVGDSAVFGVTASGSGRLGYQWRRDGVAIAGATSATLTLTNLQLADAGLYDVVVRNHVGTATSATVRLEVAAPPVIVTAPPRRVVATLGASVTLSGSATSASGPLTYRWKKNNRPIAGATSATLSLANVTRADAGAYTLEMTDALGLVSRATTFVLPAGTPTRVRAWGLNSDGQLNVPESLLPDALAVAANAKYALALRADGTVVAWGKWNSYPGANASVPTGLDEVVAVAAATDHALALRSDGTVRAWSGNGTATVPASVRGAIAIACDGGYSSALLDDGSVVTWSFYGSTVDTGSFARADIVSVKHGNDHILVLRADGTVGARALNSSSWTPSPVEVPAGLGAVAAIAAGGGQSLALKTDGSVVAWGRNRARVAIGAGSAKAIVGGPEAAAAVLTDGTLATWTGSTDDFTPPADLGAVLDFAVGYYHMVAIVDHSAGTPPVVTQQPAPVFVAAGDAFGFRVVATSATPMTYQWRKDGQPIAGATGPSLSRSMARAADAGSYDVVVANAAGSVTTEAVPLSIAVGPQVTSAPPSRVLANAGANVTLTVGANSTFGPLTYRWKKNNRPIAGAVSATCVVANFDASQAGAYTCEIVDSRGVITRVTSFVLPARGRTQYRAFGSVSSYGLAEAPAVAGDTLIDIATGAQHVVALRADGTVVAWGDNGSKQSDVPAALNNVVAVAASGYGSMALKADGTIATWGRGSNTGANPVEGLDGVIAIAMDEHFLALRSNGTVVAWTRPDLYDTVTPPNAAVTTVPANLTDVVHIAAASSLSLAVKVDGTAVAWGNTTGSRVDRIASATGLVRARAGTNSALGVRADGTLVNLGGSSSGSSLVPTGLAQVTDLAVGYYHAVALKANGTLVGWGEDTGGASSSVASVNNAFALAAAYSRTFVLRDAAADGVPTVVTQPANVGAELGSDATFSVKAGGAGPFRYQWRKNGVAISGATADTLTIPAITAVDVGSYDVVVSNHIGSVMSASASLSVGLGSAIFATVPAPRQVIAVGQPLTLAFALRDASPSYTYRWYLNARPLVGASGLAYTIAAVDSRTAGAYTLEVSDGGGVVARQTTFVLPDYGRTRVRAWGNSQSGRRDVPVFLGDAIAVSAGSAHALALRRNGTVISWGANDSGQATVPAGLKSVVALSAGTSHSLALRSDGTVVSWGNGGPVPAGLNNVIAVAADYNSRSIALKADGTVVAWGYGGVQSMPELRNITAVAVGSEHFLLLQTDGTVVAWATGTTYYNQTTVPTGLGRAVSISAAGNQSAAVAADGSVFVWGEMGANVALGQLSNPTVECGNYVGILLTGDGRVLTWGDASYGARDVPADLGAVLAVSAGNGFMLALCSAQSDAAPTISVPPQDAVVVPGAQQVFRVVATGSGTLAYQWRFNGIPITGANASTLAIGGATAASAGSYDVVVTNHVGSVTSTAATLAIASGPTVTTAPTARVQGVRGESITLTGAGTTAYGPIAYRWKKNNRPIAGATAATLNLPAFTNADAGAYTLEMTDARGLTARVTSFVLPDYSPTEVVAWGSSNGGAMPIPAGLNDVVQLASGAYFSAALKRNGSVTWWGQNVPAPPAAAGLDNLVAMSGSGSNLLGLGADGTLRPLIAGDSLASNLPAGLGGVIAASIGSNVAVALKSDGTVAVWGTASGAKVYQDYTDFVAVAAGGSHALALRLDGTVVAWGDNSYGQVTVPAGLANVIAVAAGSSHSVALRADGSVVAWGNNSSGQATVPSGLSNVTSIAAGQYATSFVKADGAVIVVGTDSWSLRTVPAGVDAVISATVGYYHMLALRSAGGDALPQITAQPQSAFAGRGSRVVLSVSATHNRPLTYQWRRNGVAITGATNASLEFAAVQDADAGDYDVVVAGPIGTVTSAVARLSVVAAPTIASAPNARQLAGPGASLTLTVAANSDHGPLTYQWRKNNRVIPGATTATYTLSNFRVEDAGAYTVEVRDARGVAARSTTFVLPAYARTQLRAWGENSNGVLAVPAISDAIAVASGRAHSLALRADGTLAAWGLSSAATPPADLTDVVAIACGGYYSMALRKDGTVRLWGNNYAIPAAVAPALKDVIAISAGNLALALRADGVIVAFSPSGSNAAGDLPPAIAGDVVGIAAGDNQQFAVTATGTVVAWSRSSPSLPENLTGVAAVAAGSYSYAALKTDGSMVTWGSFTYGAPALARAVSLGDYFAVSQGPDGVLRVWGQPSSAEAAIPTNLGTVLAFAAGSDHVVALRDASGDGAPSITVEPQSAARSVGAGYTFTVAATGVGPLTYQWFKNGVPLAEATSPQLTLAQITPADAGDYSARVSNHVGARTTAVATLTVLNLPVVTSRPATRVSVVTGQPFTLSVSATSANGPLRYQWKKKNRPISGATSPTLTVPVFNFSDTGAYTLEIVDASGATVRVTTFVVATGVATQVRSWSGSSWPVEDAVPLDLTDAIKIVRGMGYSLALRATGKVVGWGRTDSSALPPPVGLSGVVDLAASGDRNVIALTSDQKIHTWGADYPTPNTATEAIAVAAGANHYLALRADGTVVAWGANGSGQCDIPAGLSGVVAVTAGADSSAARLLDGSIVVWGNLRNVSAPPGFAGVIEVALSQYHVLTLKADGTVVAWGSGSYGESNVPASLTRAVRIAAGYGSSLAVKPDGTVVGWGNYPSPVPADLTDVVQVATDASRALALRFSANDAAPSISVHPVGQNLATGARATFSVAATGTGPLAYQWRRDGVAIAGATGTTFTIGAVSASDAASYDVVVANHRGSATSATAVLTVNSPPTITGGSSTRLVVAPGQGFSLDVAATSPNGPLTYRWKKDNRPIAGATGATYARSGFTAADAGAYTVEVSDAAGRTSRRTTFVLPSFSATQLVAFGSNGSYSLVTPPLTLGGSLVAVAAGDSFNAVLRADGTVAAWGYNYSGETNVPAGLTDVVAISARRSYTLALKSDGTVTGWGWDSNGVRTPPANVRDVIAISAGPSHALALKSDGTVVTWGYQSTGSLAVPAGLDNVVAIAAGSDYSLAVKADGSAVGWGSSSWNVPAGAATQSGLARVSADYYCAVAVKTDGTVSGWGSNSWSQLSFPADLTGVVDVSVGYYHVLARRGDGSVVAWGRNWYNEAVVPAGLSNVFAIAAGSDRSLVLRNASADGGPSITTAPQSLAVIEGSTVLLSVVATGAGPLSYQWRKDGVAIAGATSASLTLSQVALSQAGRYDVVVANHVGSVASAAATVTVNPLPAVTALSARRNVVAPGGSARLSVTASGTGVLSYQWFRNGRAIAGATAAAVELTNLTRADAGWYFCAITDAVGTRRTPVQWVIVAPERTQVLAWGSTESAKTTVPVGLNDAVAVAAGSAHSVAIRRDGSLVAWGASNYVPPTSASVGSVVATVGVSDGLITLHNDGNVRAWGYSNNVPPGLSEVVAVAGGYGNVLALRADGTVAYWTGSYSSTTATVPLEVRDLVGIAVGRNGFLGLKLDGTLATWGSSPVSIPAGLNGVSAIAAGSDHWLALRTDGTVTAWGSNGSGQINVPAGLTDVVAISATAYGSFALKRDGMIVAWGSDSYGEVSGAANRSDVWALATATSATHQLALRASAADTAPVIVTPPTALSVGEGARANFSVVVSGQGPLSYQWQKNGEAIAGATAALFAIDGVQPSDAGAYRVVVTNHIGSVTSATANLAVEAAPVFTQRPVVRQAGTPGAAITLTGAATSVNAPISYQWKKDNRLLVGATSASYTIPSFSNSDAGAYTLVATDTRGNTSFATTFILPTYGAVQLRQWGATGMRVPTNVGQVIDVATNGYTTVVVRLDGTLMGWNSSLIDVSPASSSPVVRVAMGNGHLLRLHADGKVSAWGSGSNGPANVPPWLRDVIAVAAGDSHSLALRADGTVVAWGDNRKGQATVPSGLSNVVALAANADFSAALKADGTVVVWGDNYYGQRNVPAGLAGVVQLVAGSYHFLARKFDGTVVAWGGGSYGETTVPTNLADVVEIAAGAYGSIARRADGSFAIWGQNIFGTTPTAAEIGIVHRLTAAGTTLFALRDARNDLAPVITTQPVGIAGASVGNTYTFTVAATGAGPLSYLWRKNGTPISYETSTTLNLYYISESAAASYDVVVSNHVGSVTSNVASLTLGTVSAISTTAPRRQIGVIGQPLELSIVPASSGSWTYQWKKNGRPITGATGTTFSLASFTNTDAGAYTLEATSGSTVTRLTFFVLPDYAFTRVWAWGQGPLGQTTPPSGLVRAIAVAAGDGHSLALQRDGTVTAWGANLLNQSAIPDRVASAVAVAAGANHSLALLADGTVVGWGGNGYSQSSIPSGLFGVTAIAAGANYSLALRNDGSVAMWGYNAYSTPSLNNAVAIAAGALHSLALKADGTVVAWGDNAHAQTSVPSDLAGVTAIAAGNHHSLALRADGTVVAWGRNHVGQATVPAGLAGIVAIAAAADYSLALKADGTLVAWGDLSAGVGSPNFAGAPFALSAGGRHALALTDNSTETAPSILAHPQGEAVRAAATISLRVQAVGSGTLSYRWYRNGTALDDTAARTGTQTATLTLGSFAAGDVGNYTVVVSNANGSVTSVAAVLTHEKTPQSITFAPADRVYTAATSTLAAMSSSGLPVSFELVSGPAQLSGSTLTLTGAGQVTVRATQGGNDTYAAAPAVDRTFTVGKAASVLTLGNLFATFDGMPKSATATTNPDGLGVTITYNGWTPAPIGAGTYTVTATIADARFAGTATGTLTIEKASQTITFAGPADQAFTTNPLTLTASATSGLDVVFSVVSGPATVVGNSLQLLGSGTIKVRASQAGDENHLAGSVDRTFVVGITFDAWRLSYFSAGELLDSVISGPSADPDADGLSNLMEYALGSHPRTNSAANAPVLAVADGAWTFTYARPADRSDITYSVECSTNLSSWSSTGVTHTRIDVSGSVETWRANYPSNSAPCFFRLAVSRP